jgi:hypothetical protein
MNYFVINFEELLLQLSRKKNKDSMQKKTFAIIIKICEKAKY